MTHSHIPTIPNIPVKRSGWTNPSVTRKLERKKADLLTKKSILASMMAHCTSMARGRRFWKKSSLPSEWKAMLLSSSRARV